MTVVRPWQGFNYLNDRGATAISPMPVRLLLLGGLLGLMLGWTLMARDREALEAQGLRQAALHAQVRAAEAAMQAATEQARRAQVLQGQDAQWRFMRMQRLAMLACLEDMARTPRLQVAQLRFDGQALHLHGQMPSAQLPAWAALQWVPEPAGPAALLDIKALSDTPGDAGLVQFVLRWPWAAEPTQPPARAGGAPMGRP